jgi:transcriptional regulator GlxA family with amidase domain
VRVGRFLLEPDHGLDRLARADTVLVPGWADVDAVAEAVGMGTATTLRRHFNRTVGVPPDTYRRTFRS